MPPERDSPGRENGDREEKSGSTNAQKVGPEVRSRSRSSATEMGKRVRSIGTLGMIPVLLAVGPIIGVFIGQWLDKKFGSSPWLTVLFVILGFVASVREMIQLLKRYSGEDDKKAESTGSIGVPTEQDNIRNPNKDDKR